MDRIFLAVPQYTVKRKKKVAHMKVIEAEFEEVPEKNDKLVHHLISKA